MKALSRIIGVAALVLVATAGTAVAARVQPHMVPIKGSVLALDSGQIFGTEDDPLDCPAWAEWQFFSRGTGQVSHLGRTHLDLLQCSRFVTPPVAPPILGASLGTTTFTAANGDTLVLAHDLEFEVYLNDLGDFDGFDGHGTWTVAGGSGRFTGATGHGTIGVVGDIPSDDTPMFDLPVGGTSWTFAGMISYHSSK